MRRTGMRVFVQGLEVEAEVGVYPSERGRRQRLVFDVELHVETPRIERLSDTVNYEVIQKAARALAESGHIELLESFAERLAAAFFRDARVTAARIRVEKPGILGPQARTAGVELLFERPGSV